MARRRGTKRLYLYPNVQQLAQTVIGSYLQKVPPKLREMQYSYVQGVESYIRDPAKQQLANTKLSLWYSALRDYVDQISGIYGQVRARYKANLRAMIGVAPVPPPPAPAVPAVAPAPVPR